MSFFGELQGTRGLVLPGGDLSGPPPAAGRGQGVPVALFGHGAYKVLVVAAVGEAGVDVAGAFPGGLKG